MIRLAATTAPVDLAWTAFDDAAIRLNRMYATAPLSKQFDDSENRKRRQDAAINVLRLWEEWRELFLGDEPGDAA